MKSEGYAPEQFPFQTLVNSSDYQSYIWFLWQRKSQKQGRRSYQKNIPYLSQKNEKKGGHCTGPLIKKKISSSIYSSFEHSLRNPTWKIYWEPTEFHGVMRRIVNLLLNSHGREFILCTNQIGLSNSAESIPYRQVRHSWVHTGKFAILEFIPASSPFLSSQRQVRHSWVHTGKFAIFVFTPARFANFWVRSGKIRQFLSS